MYILNTILLLSSLPVYSQLGYYSPVKEKIKHSYNLLYSSDTTTGVEVTLLPQLPQSTQMLCQDTRNKASLELRGKDTFYMYFPAQHINDN